MRVKHIIISLLLVLILVIFNRIFLGAFYRANSYFSTQTLYSTEEASPQKLFDKTWRVIYKDYYDSSLNHQNWERWRDRYQGKIHGLARRQVGKRAQALFAGVRLVSFALFQFM